MNKTDLYKTLDEYYNKFGDIFPMSELKSYSQEDMIKLARECIEKDEPYQSKLEDEGYLIDY